MAGAGACAGFATFALLDPTLGAQEAGGRAGGAADLQDGLGQAVTHAILLGCTLGASVGGALVLAEEAATKRIGRIVGRVLLGALVGALCGGVGGVGGQVIFSIMLVPMAFAGQGAIPFVIAARTAGWSLVGAAAGICPGVVAGSQRRIRQGSIGGLLGGAGGGALFDAIASVTQAGSISRCVGLTLIGFAVGALVGLIEEAGKQVWLTMLSGAREGRTYILTKPATLLGRNEMADIPLFGDTTVQRAHAAILLNGNEAEVRAMASPILVNGQPAAAARLTNGDILTIGRHRIRFSSRHATAPLPLAPIDGVYRAPGQIPFGAGGAGIPQYLHAPQAQGGMGSGPGAYYPQAQGGTGFYPAPQAPFAPGDAAIYPPAPMPPGPDGAPTLSLPAMSQAAAAGVTVIAGPHLGATFPLFDGAIAGRDPRCDIVLIHDTQASRQHARFLFDGSAWSVEDGGSANGTYVNGRRIALRVLQPGDQVTLGGTVLQIG